MQTWHVVLIVLLVLIGVLVGMYFWGKKIQKRQEENQKQMDAAKQTVTMLVIDKKILRAKDSGLPQMVIDQIPRLMRRSKLPVVKAKIGPRIMVMIADQKVFDIIPLKKEVKATISGIYITEVRGLRGPLTPPPKKEGFFKRMTNKVKAIGKNK